MHYTKLLLPLLCLCLLSGCRYWSLYRFADQFCAFDQYIEVQTSEAQTSLTFVEPVLPQAVFQRYFKAEPYREFNEDGVLQHNFRIQTLTNARQFEVSTFFSLVDGRPLFQKGTLDARLSALFQKDFVDAVLRSACTDDFDFSLSRLVLRFQLDQVPEHSLPQRNALVTQLHARPDSNAYEQPDPALWWNTQFDFLSASDAAKTLQDKKALLRFRFDSHDRLAEMNVAYLNYFLELDFDQQTGKLTVIRNQ